MEDIFVAFGGELKALGEGRVGGVGVQFTGKDLDGEGFRAETYYGARAGDGADCLFHHSLPIKGVSPELCDHIFAPVKATKRELDIFFETVLDMANEYERYVYDLIDKGKLGWSTGAPGHMVRKTTEGMITRWPISEVSFTPTPAEPRNRVLSLKSLQEEGVIFDAAETWIYPISENGKTERPFSLDEIATEREYEFYLRARGCAKDEAKALVAIAKRGFKALCQREAEETAVQAALIEQLARDRALLDLSYLTGV